MQKEIPILFSTAMVQSILAGWKTQTRRTVKFPADFDQSEVILAKNIKEELAAIGAVINGEGVRSTKCPYGNPGDVLYVRESWQLHAWDFEDGNATFNYATGHSQFCNMPDESDAYLSAQGWLERQVESLVHKGYFQPASFDESSLVRTDKQHPFKPSIHMPKWAARIWLQVEDVRVERLQDISPTDAFHEGVERWDEDFKSEPGAVSASYRNYLDNEDWFANPIDSFQSLWHSINGRESWDANPWVWVITYKVLSTTGRPAINQNTSINDTTVH